MKQNNNKTNNQKEESCGAIWRKTSTSGSEYLFIKMKDKQGKEHSFVAFTNKFKNEGENRPEWNLFVSKTNSSTSKPAQKSEPEESEI